MYGRYIMIYIHNIYIYIYSIYTYTHTYIYIYIYTCIPDYTGIYISILTGVHSIPRGHKNNTPHSVDRHSAKHQFGGAASTGRRLPGDALGDVLWLAPRKAMGRVTMIRWLLWSQRFLPVENGALIGGLIGGKHPKKRVSTCFNHPRCRISSHRMMPQCRIAKMT